MTPPSPDDPGGDDEPGEDVIPVTPGDDETMTEAITNAISNAPEGSTVQLPEPDPDNPEAITLDTLFVDRSVTIDLNGNTIEG